MVSIYIYKGMDMKLKKTLLLSMVCGMFLHGNSDIFTLNVDNTTQGDSYIETSNSLEGIIDKIDLDTINSNISYNETNALSANLDFRGLPVTLNFSENSTAVVFSVPSLGITETFMGSNRDDSLDLLVDWFKVNGKETVERIMKKLAEVSPIDPIAGNPNSLMATTVESDFDKGFMDVARKQKDLKTKKTGARTKVSKSNRIVLGPSYKSLDIDGKRSQSYTLPLGYSFVDSEDSLRSFNVSLPLSYTDVEGATSYGLGLGISYSTPVNSQWVVTPGIKYSMVGSADLGSLAQMGSLSVSSTYSIPLDNNHMLSIGNMIGYYSTLKLYDGDYAYDPGIQNTVFRNALMYSLPTENIAKDSSLDLYVIDTQYTGSKLYLTSYDEFGFSFGYRKLNVNVLSDKSEYAYERELKMGLSYLTSSKANGVKVNFGFVF
jgi:hypothetical protein